MELSNKAVWCRCAAAIVVLASLQPLWFMQGGVFILESIKQVVYSVGLAACSAVLSQVAWPHLSRGALVKIFLGVGAVVALPLVVLSWVVAMKL